jgi:hypothetical protein
MDSRKNELGIIQFTEAERGQHPEAVVDEILQFLE